jgi:TusA-related sulfurtransferase
MSTDRYTPPLPRADVVVDAVGLVCPGPIVLLAKAVKDAQLGQVIEVVATDAGILADAPAWANRTGHMIIGAYSDDGRHRFWFRKAHE